MTREEHLSILMLLTKIEPLLYMTAGTKVPDHIWDEWAVAVEKLTKEVMK